MKKINKNIALFSILTIGGLTLPNLVVSCSSNNDDSSNNQNPQPLPPSSEPQPLPPSPEPQPEPEPTPPVDNDLADGIWKPYGLKRKNFSYNNSLKVSFVHKVDNAGRMAIESGTAWTLDICEKNNKMQWYLMTNYHVVKDALKFNNPTEFNNRTPIVEITRGFTIRKPKEKNNPLNTKYGAYELLTEKNMGLANDGPRQFTIEKVEVITDYNNDDIELFSKGNIYNLDMAIIRISMNKNEYQKKQDFFNNLNQPIDLNKRYKTYSGSKVFIAGNPVKDKQLVVDDLDNVQPIRKNEINIAPGHFKGWYYDSAYMPFSEWALSPGASGSPVYAWDENMTPNVYPVGIYWGILKKNTRGQIKSPSFYPFITSDYNIWNNIYSLLENNII